MALVRVLNLPELLASILLELPVTDMFKVKAVSKQWKDAIDKTPSLQKAMFLLAEGEPIQPVRRSKEAWANPPHDKWIGAMELERKSFTAVPLYGPELAMKYEDMIEDWEHHVNQGHSQPWDMDLKVYRFMWELRLFNGFPLPTAWRSAFLTQPPVTALLLYGYGVLWVHASLYDPAGITLGLVQDTVAQMLRQLDFMEYPLFLVGSFSSMDDQQTCFRNDP